MKRESFVRMLLLLLRRVFKPGEFDTRPASVTAWRSSLPRSAGPRSGPRVFLIRFQVKREMRPSNGDKTTARSAVTENIARSPSDR